MSAMAPGNPMAERLVLCMARRPPLRLVPT